MDIPQVPPLDRSRQAEFQALIDHKTKPVGALGQLESLALQLALIQHTPQPVLQAPHVVVFAADHGLAASGVSLYPQAVTRQMVLNFVRGGAAVSVFARQHGMALVVVDAGVAGGGFTAADLALPHEAATPPAGPLAANLWDYRLGDGTANALHGPAMPYEVLADGLRAGAEVVQRLRARGCNVLGLGEMGIGNTSSAALLMHRLTSLPLADCVGAGTGLGPDGVLRKATVLQQVAQRHAQAVHPLDALAAFGGFEIVEMVGAYLAAAAAGMVVLVDGFIATAAVLVAAKLQPAVTDYCIFSHQSDERGHRALLAHVGAKPLLSLGMRLGEGSAAALAYPLLVSAAAMLRDMASFADAGVSTAEASTGSTVPAQ